jgi:hypothetical protein
MQGMAEQVEPGHLCIGDLDASGILPYVDRDGTSRPVSVVPAVSWTIVRERLATPVDSDDEKTGCSIFFHLLVPWQIADRDW